MKSLYKHFFATASLLAVLIPSCLMAKGYINSRMYLFGLSASFNDTIVHITEIQSVDSALIDPNTKYLLGREHYSYQLRNYLAEQGMPQRTCIVFFNKSQKKIQKKYLKIKKLYIGDKIKKKKEVSHNDVRIIPTADFHFSNVDMGLTDNPNDEMYVKKSKKSKKKK